jgi:hypothetical protein
MTILSVSTHRQRLAEAVTETAVKERRKKKLE